MHARRSWPKDASLHLLHSGSRKRSSLPGRRRCPPRPSIEHRDTRGNGQYRTSRSTVRRCQGRHGVARPSSHTCARDERRRTQHRWPSDGLIDVRVHRQHSACQYAHRTTAGLLSTWTFESVIRRLPISYYADNELDTLCTPSPLSISRHLRRDENPSRPFPAWSTQTRGKGTLAVHCPWCAVPGDALPFVLLANG